MRQLGRSVQSVVAGRRLVLRDRGPRFHRIRHQLVDEVDPSDVIGLGKGGFGRRLVADRPIAAQIARHIVIELRRAGLYRLDDPGHRRQDMVFDTDALGGVAGGRDAVGDDHRDRVADMQHLAARQQTVLRRLLHRVAVFPGDSSGAQDAVELVGGDVFAHEDRGDAGALHRLGRVDRDDLRMGMGRAQEHGMQPPWSHDVVDIAPAPG